MGGAVNWAPPSTKDYSMFEMHHYNRPLDNKPLLEKSMREHGFMPSSPIQCVRNDSGNLMIVRGHHRFNIAKQLGLPVYYVIDDSNVDIFALEGSSGQGWTSKDFMVARSRAGEADYVKLADFMAAHSLTLGAASSLVGGQSAESANKIATLKDGSFKVGNMDHANAVVAITDLCRALSIEFATSTGFVGAVSAALRIPEINVEQLRRRITTHHKELARRSRRDDYLEELEAVYNYMARGPKLPLKMRAIEVMLIRQKARVHK